MSSVIEKIERAQLRRVPSFSAGDRVKVHFQVIEGSRSRVQVFEGVVIKRQGHGARETFTVRKQSFGVGVERTFPLHSPKIERIEVASRGDVRRAKLYYLRDRVGKAARVRERGYVGPEVVVEPGLLHAPVAQEAEAPEAVDAVGETEGIEETEAVESVDAAGEPEGIEETEAVDAVGEPEGIEQSVEADAPGPGDDVEAGAQAPLADAEDAVAVTGEGEEAEAGDAPAEPDGAPYDTPA